MHQKISWAIIDLTDFCNFNCQWCFSNVNSNYKGTNLNFSDLEKILLILQKTGVRQVTYSGGEPTLYPNLVEAVRIAKKHGFIVHLNSNGYLLTESFVENLASEGLSQVQINIESLDADKHDRIRGKKGALAHAINAIDHILKCNLSCVIATVITKSNYSEIKDIVNFVRQKGVDRYRVWNMLPAFGVARINSDTILTNYFEILHEISDHVSTLGAKFVEVGDPLFKTFIDSTLDFNGGYCLFSRGLSIYIATNGDVYFCGTYRKPVYNIFDVIERSDDLNVIHKQSIEGFLTNFPITNSCKSCDAVDTCKGGCITRRDFTEDTSDYLCKYCYTNQPV